MNSINKEKRKSSLPKGIKSQTNSIQTQPSNSYMSQSQVMQSQSRIQNKLQPSSSINLNSVNSINQQPQNVSKTVK